MKKFMFTAIALVAFSGVSIANTFEIVPLVKFQKFSVNSEKKILPTDRQTQCEAVKFRAYVDARADGLSDTAARNLSYTMYFGCMGFGL
jgi:hypothetical protein